MKGSECKGEKRLEERKGRYKWRKRKKGKEAGGLRNRKGDKKIKEGKATGEDGISNGEICRKVWKREKFPERWKGKIIVADRKKERSEEGGRS